MGRPRDQVGPQNQDQGRCLQSQVIRWCQSLVVGPDQIHRDVCMESNDVKLELRAYENVQDA